MHIETDITKRDCQFKNCRYFIKGKCINDEARKNCIEIALAVLNALDRKKYNYACEFCTDLHLASIFNQERAEKINRKDTMGKAVARMGVRFVTYVTNEHYRLHEKNSRKAYKLLYCPVCGRLLCDYTLPTPKKRDNK